MSDLALGVNYWPASSAMRMWQRFDATEIERDFARVAAAGCNTVRIFLLWEDFQPDPRSVDDRALERLRAVADIAARTAVKLIPTLFTGHMSGVNWIPGWALGEQTPGRFRTVTGGAVARRPSRDWAQDAEIRTAQALLAREAAGALAGHRALGMWDLGNENSNCWVPQSREDGRRWLHAMAGAIRDADPTTPITLGLHAEDLEEDRRIGPAEAAEVSDVLSMHGYPMYLRWARGKDDARVLPFLAAITRWLGQKDVLFEEFGAPTLGPGDPPSAGSGSCSVRPRRRRTPALRSPESTRPVALGRCSGATRTTTARSGPRRRSTKRSTSVISDSGTPTVRRSLSSRSWARGGTRRARLFRMRRGSACAAKTFI